MSAPEHDRDALGAYALGALGPDETRAIHAHLAGCAECRAEVAELNELHAMLGEVPPEAFLDGPPEDGDLLLQRTLRQVRAETGARPAAPVHARPGRTGTTRRGFMVAAAAVLVAGAGVAGGVLIGRETVEPVATPTVSPPPVIGQKTVRATDARTGTSITATVVPKAGWVTVQADVKNLPVGAQCELRVVDTAGKSLTAGSWLVSEKTAKEGSVVEGGALVPIGKVKSIDVVTFQGQRMVSVPV